MVRLLIVFLLAFVSLRAQQASTVYNFLETPASSLSNALGGSQVASAQKDVSMIADNPAIADSAMDNNLNLGYLNNVGNLNQATAFYSRMIDSVGMASAYLRYFDYGSFDETDEFGNQIGTFRVSDYELGLSLSRQLKVKKQIRYGATFKQVYSAYYGYWSYGIGADFGAHFTSKSGELTMGLVADNLGLSIADYTNSGVKPMPFNMKFGIAKKFSKAPIRLGLQYNHIERWDLASSDADAQLLVRNDALTGDSTRRVFTLDNFMRHLSASVEIVPSDGFNLIVGYNFRRRMELALNDQGGLSGLSFGVLIKVKRIHIQYALANYTLGATSHLFAVTTNLNEWYRKK